jgi:hypothetical protein
MSKWKKVCRICGSEDLNFDAFVQWDVDLQDYRVENIYDNVWCCSCEGETTEIDIRISEVPINAKIL